MLLRRITSNIVAQNWVAIAIDFFIVVVGVFIGLQMSNWNDERISVAEEAALLSETRTSLDADVREMERVLSHYRRIDDRIGELLVHMKEGRAYKKTLDSDFGVL